MPRLQKDKAKLAFCKVNFLGNLTLHFASKISISTRHWIVQTSINIKRNPCEGMANNKL